MIVTVMFNGKPFGSPMDGLRDDDLLWFIKSQLGLQITPEEQDIFDERGDV